MHTKVPPVLSSIRSTDKVLKPYHFQTILKDILSNDLVNKLTEFDGNGLADEISTQASREVTFEDFKRLFR